MIGNSHHKVLQATMGFVQVRLEVVAIGSSAYPGFCSRLDQHRQTLVLNIYPYQKPGSGYGRKEF